MWVVIPFWLPVVGSPHCNICCSHTELLTFLSEGFVLSQLEASTQPVRLMNDPVCNHHTLVLSIVLQLRLRYYLQNFLHFELDRLNLVKTVIGRVTELRGSPCPRYVFAPTQAMGYQERNWVTLQAKYLHVTSCYSKFRHKDFLPRTATSLPESHGCQYDNRLVQVDVCIE